ncbi:5' [Octopus vulgaris]|uniref:Deoxyuridine 5'-triphosphate nucleotidohydrolase n=1 Tax=Octopus vulgaris TaxID=6645 RepID=A0AA36FJ40_OCTVU|nr:5' [Octopus vulgaris]
MPAKQVVKFARLSQNAFIPTRGSPQAAGYDLYSAYEYTVPSKGKLLAKTDLQIALPEGCYGRVAPRSGLALKHFIDVGAGVIDQDYRGNVGVLLFNFSETDFKGRLYFLFPCNENKEKNHFIILLFFISQYN